LDGQNDSVNVAGVLNESNVITGFRLYWLGGSSFTAGTVRVYGVRAQ
jgi:hypothetical protein